MDGVTGMSITDIHPDCRLHLHEFIIKCHGMQQSVTRKQAVAAKQRHQRSKGQML